MEVTDTITNENTEGVENDNDLEEAPKLQDVPKKSKKGDKSNQDDKNVELFMKSLSSMPAEDKLLFVCKKYVQGADENRKMQFYIKQANKRYALLVKEKDQLQHEYNKTILVKSKLENLCRELQKHNKVIKEESLLKIREEEERRKETQAKFQNTLSEITTLLQQNNDKNTKLRDDNISMTEKFKSLVQQYQLREQQVEKMSKQMSLESQLSNAKMQKAVLEHQAEKEKILAEAEQMKMTIAQYRAKILELQATETALKGQLGVYTDKYDEFQNALVKSNQVFGGFKEQMEKMSKKIQKLEKESLSWKKRWETSQTALLDMCGERQASEEKAATANKHLHHMQGLCRTLQAERTLLLNTLKEHSIERPPLPAVAPAPPIPPAYTASDAKVDAMAANCVHLRQSLAHLQTQLNTLTNNKEKEEPPKSETKKKSKSKKKDKAQKTTENVEIAEKPKEQVETVENKETTNLIPEATRVSETTEVSLETVDEPKIKDIIDEIQSIEAKVDENVDVKTMENLMQAINLVSINLSDLEAKEEKNPEKNKVSNGEVNEAENCETKCEIQSVAQDTNNIIATEPTSAAEQK